jgi:type II secretory pathway component PulF
MKGIEFIGSACAAVIAGLIPLYAFSYLLYFLVGLPLRRQERARLFLDLIETGLTQGRSIENTIVSISRSRDQSVGVRFHLLAAYLESGWKLVPALEKVGTLVPPQFVAMLRVGEEIGEPRRILPACRALLKDATSQIQSAYNYLVVLAFVLIPVVPALFWMMTVFVLPRYKAIFAEMLEGEVLPPVPFELAALLSQIQLGVALLFYIGAIFYVGGPRLISWLQAGLSVPNFDWLLYRIPWRRKRMQRDFAAMLGALLDAQVPEERAVALAGASTANRSFMKRATGVVAQLRQGVKLTEAIAGLDESGEFRWRLANAIHSGKNFLLALAGWLDALEAKAFQQQQAFAQLVTTAFVLYNGLMVTLFAVFVFHGITMMIDEGVLW